MPCRGRVRLGVGMSMGRSILYWDVMWKIWVRIPTWVQFQKLNNCGPCHGCNNAKGWVTPNSLTHSRPPEWFCLTSSTHISCWIKAISFRSFSYFLQVKVKLLFTFSIPCTEWFDSNLSSVWTGYWLFVNSLKWACLWCRYPHALRITGLFDNGTVCERQCYKDRLETWA